MRFYSFYNFNILLLFRSPGTLSAKLKNVSSVLWFPSKKSFIPGQKLLLELLLKLVCIYSDDNIWALFTVPRPLSRFGTHFQAWLGRKCVWSRRSYGKVEDFEQSSLPVFSSLELLTFINDVSFCFLAWQRLHSEPSVHLGFDSVSRVVRLPPLKLFIRWKISRKLYRS